MWTGAPTYRVVVKNTKIQNIVKVALEGTLDGVQKPDILSFSYQAKIGDDAASIAEGLTASINQSPASAVFGVRANRRDNAVELLIPANLVQLTKAKWHPSPTDVAQEVTISETQVK